MTSTQPELVAPAFTLSLLEGAFLTANAVRARRERLNRIMHRNLPLF
jgi:hypothetical protein